MSTTIQPVNGQNILDQGEFEFHSTTETGIRFRDETPEEYWREKVEELCHFYENGTGIADRSGKLLGDALNFGEHKWPEEYAQAIDGLRTHLRPKTLTNAMRVCKAVKAEVRGQKLTLGHLDAIARLPETDQKKMVEIAEAEDLTVAALRKIVKIEYPKEPPKHTKGTKRQKKAIIDLQDDASMLLCLEKLVEYIAKREADEHITKWTDKKQWLTGLKALANAEHRARRKGK